MEEYHNPFARGQMSGRIKRAANEFMGFDEHIISEDRVVAVQYGAYEIEEFGRAWGQVHVYEYGNLQTDGYLSYDAILTLRDIGSRVYEVRYNEQETEWDSESQYIGKKYECYGKKIVEDRVILAKWGDCAERQLVLTKVEYAELCQKIEQMPSHFGDFDQYKARIRPRKRGEHRYLIEEKHMQRTKEYTRDVYGRRISDKLTGWHREILPYDHGYGRIDDGYFLLGTPDVWTAQFSPYDFRTDFRLALRGKCSMSDWKDYDVVFTRYEKGLQVQRCRLSFAQVLAVAKEPFPVGKILLLPLGNQENTQEIIIQWNEEWTMIYTVPDSSFTELFWFRVDVWQWVLQQTPEFEYHWRLLKI